jgi:hypothetical protein
LQQLVVVLAAWQPEVAAVPVVLQEAAVAVAFARPAAVVGPAAAVAAALVVPQQAGSARGPPAAPAPRASAAAVSRVVVEAAPIASRPVMAACVLQAGSEAAKPCSSRRKAAVRREEEVAACRSWCLGSVTVVWSGRPLHPPGSWPTECLTMVVACRSSAVAVARRVHRAKVVRSACRSGSEVRCQARPLLRVRGAVCQSARAGHSMPDWSSSRVARCRALSAG